jgi:transglutaminase-like putative cysteine protease
MKRRSLLKAAPAAGLLAAAPWARAQSTATVPATAAQTPAGWRTYEVVTRLEVTPPTGTVLAWVPLPLAQATSWFEPLGNRVGGNAESAQTVSDPVYGATMVAAKFRDGESAPVVEVTSRFRTRDRLVSMTPGSGETAAPSELKTYLKSTDLMPTDGIVRETALKATQGVNGDVARARAIYDWTVENTERNPKTRGCGSGDVRAMLEAGTLNGKCADLNAIFVALCRSVGIPARDVYGIRVATSPRGYRSMGPQPGVITKAQHCRAEFYAQGIGWVPVDPADVRKVVLEEAPGLTLADARVKEARSFLWGGWEGNWMPYNFAHDLRLPGSSRAPVPFLMYPQAENAQGRLDSLDPDNFRYSIVSREVVA